MLKDFQRFLVLNEVEKLNWVENTQSIFNVPLLEINNQNLTNVENPKLAEAIDMLKRQDIVPEPILKRLNTKVNADFNNPGMVKEFRENLSLYNFMKSQYPNLDIENAFIYDEANNLMAEGMSDDKLLGSRLNTLAGDAKNYTANKEKINSNLEPNVNRVLKYMRILLVIWISILIPILSKSFFCLKKIGIQMYLNQVVQLYFLHLHLHLLHQK